MTTWLIANWKMNGNVESVRAFAFAVNQSLAQHVPSLRVGFCPPSLYLAEARAALPDNACLLLGAQNCHAKMSGAFTGEISAGMVREAGATCVIIGHSERRALGENDTEVTAKAVAVQQAGMLPVICIGESLADYEAGRTQHVVDAQLAPLKPLKAAGMLIAYEPIWAIGSGKTPQMHEIAAVAQHIKSVLGSEGDVLYGGSVTPETLGNILALPEISGALIGGASLKTESMIAMVDVARGVARA